jgi:NtrC-family two-component system sensor histidine kinase KinB
VTTAALGDDGIGDEEPDLAGARAQLAAAEDRLRNQTMLMAEAEHRLKTALSVVTGWAATLDDRWDQLDESRRREGVAIIRRASEGMALQATRLLEGARAEILGMDALRVDLDLDAVLGATTSSYGGVSVGHAVVHDPSTVPVPVVTDPASLQQVLGHLIENAVKYSARGTTVVVRARRSDDGGAVLEVADEGVGVPLGVDLFEPFERGGVSPDVSGVGLGLYIVRTLVRSMGAEIDCVRNDPRPGSTFTVTFPPLD